jgi:hypothetical protein
MDETLKKQIYLGAMILSILILLFSLIGNYRISNKLEDDYIAVDRSPLQQFRLIDYREDSSGAYIDVVSVKTGKKYENNFISLTCPQGKTKLPGLIMNLSIVENIRTNNEEKFYTLDRAYDYICTNIDMHEADKQLFERIKEARDRTYNLPNNNQKN